MEEKKIISILGCGKLGLPVAKILKNKGYIIKASTTTKKKIKEFDKLGFKPYLLDCNYSCEVNFFKSDIIIIILPFKKSFEDPMIYFNQIYRISEYIESSPIKHIVFTSSSSIYPKDGYRYLPSDNFTLTSKRSRILDKCEKRLEIIHNSTSIIIRLGGLIASHRRVSSSDNIRRLISEESAIKYIVESATQFYHNDCINAFRYMIY